MLSIMITLFLIMFVLPYGVYRIAKRHPPVNGSTSGPSGVGGWLLLLVVGLIYLGPLLGLGSLKQDFDAAETKLPSLLTDPTWSILRSATWSSFLLVCCLSIYAGFSLAIGRRFAVIRRAKIVLWVIGPVAYIIMGILIPFLIYGKSGVDPNFILSLMASIVVSSIWTAYLSKSRRVKATYGER